MGRNVNHSFKYSLRYKESSMIDTCIPEERHMCPPSPQLTHSLSLTPILQHATWCPNIAYHVNTVWRVGHAFGTRLPCTRRSDIRKTKAGLSHFLLRQTACHKDFATPVQWLASPGLANVGFHQALTSCMVFYLYSCVLTLRNKEYSHIEYHFCPPVFHTGGL